MSGIALCSKDQEEILAPALTDNDYHNNTIVVLTAYSSLSVCTSIISVLLAPSLSGKGMTDAIVKSTECYDIALVVTGEVSLSGLSDVEKYCYLNNHFIPSSQDQMLSEEVKVGEKTKKLRFQMKWLGQYHWLVYSPSMSGGFSKFCVLFGKSVSTRGGQIGGNLGVLVTKPMMNLKRALGTDGILPTHEKAEYHINATVLANSFIATYENPTLHVDNIIEKCSNEQYQNKLHVLEIIISTITLLGRQGLSLRGHRDDV